MQHFFRQNVTILFSIIFTYWLTSTIVTGKPVDHDRLDIGRFSLGSLEGWQSKELRGKTDYQLTTLDNIKVLRADSNQAASGMYYEQPIDLTKTPYLNWRWRIDSRLANTKEQEKAGDDFVARVYVIVSGGLVFWNTKAVNYVWANQVLKHTVWPNPFAGKHAMMFALRSNDDTTGTWYSEKRNIREDFKQLTGEAIHAIDAVAIMTDTDNSGSQASAYYGDIYFSAE